MTLKSWFPVFALAFAAFIFNTTEFVPVGLLPEIGQSFDQTPAQTGLMMTGYAWMVALLSLPLTVMTAKIERRQLLVVLFMIFIASHALSGVASSFTMLMTGRIGIACAHAVFWSISIPLAARMAPSGQTAKALAFMVTGSSLATVLGVPIGTMVGQLVGWRMTFLCIGAMASVIMLILVYLLPKLESNNAGSFKSIPSLFKRPALRHAYILIAVIVTGHFTAYTYITPFMNDVGLFGVQFIVYLLLFFGGAGIIGGVIFAHYANRYPVLMLLLPIAVVFGCLAVLYFSTAHMVSVILVCVIWGVGFTLISMNLQTKILAVAKDAADVAIAMFSGIFNIGIGAGALMGSYVVTSLGVGAIGYAGAGFVLGALLLACISSRQYWKAD